MCRGHGLITPWTYHGGHGMGAEWPFHGHTMIMTMNMSLGHFMNTPLNAPRTRHEHITYVVMP